MPNAFLIFSKSKTLLSGRGAGAPNSAVLIGLQTMFFSQSSNIFPSETAPGSVVRICKIVNPI